MPSASDPVPSLCMLLIEDNPDLREILTTLLSQEGYIPLVMDSLEAALRTLRTTSACLVLLDLYDPPDLATFALLHPLLLAAGSTPVGLITAWHVEEEQARRAGFDFVLAKPFDLEDLLWLIEQSLRWRSGGGPG